MGIILGGADLTELIELALLLIATGALSGFLAGLFGIGGGAVLVPVFYECFRLAGVPLEVRMPLCIGTSLAVIIPTSIRSFRAHYLRGAVDMDVVKAWWLVIIIGVIAGSAIARHAPERLFKYVFVAVAWSATLPAQAQPQLTWGAPFLGLETQAPVPVWKVFGCSQRAQSAAMGVSFSRRPD